jgi:tRNA(Ile)-lysidine synthase
VDLATLAAQLEPHRQRPRWWLAYSGGLDSSVLLHLLCRLREQGGWPPLSAVHVNHQLNPRAADWADHCRSVCAAAGIELVVTPVTVARRAGRGLEAAARAARYAAFEAVLGDGELLLQAHHRDDQLETLLLRLLRGAGLAGLAAIPALRALGRGQLLRPLLDRDRAEFADYAHRQGLGWVDDDSNDDTGFDRNVLRLRVVPVLAERWPRLRETLAQLTGQAAEAEQLLRELAALDLAVAQRDGDRLAVSACVALSAPRQRNLLRHWLRQRGLPLPGRAQLAQAQALLRARADAEPLVSWPGVELRRYRDRLYAQPPLPPLPVATAMAWSPPLALAVAGAGTLSAQPVAGGGLRRDRAYSVRPRRGGERCRPQGRAHSQTLKKLLQEAELAPWWRDRLPLVYCGDQLAAVADLWVCEGFQAAAGEPGWQLDWQPPGPR